MSMMKEVKVKQSCIVRPAKETPKGSLWLSGLDIVIREPYTHTPSVFIYCPKQDYDNPSNFFDFSIMKDALSQALVYFYPIAGRLRKNENTGRLEIDCNGEGALFIEAETQLSLDDFGEYFTPNAEFREVVIPPCDYSGGCGGVTIGLAQNHQVGDGSSFIHFLVSWGRLVQGLDLAVLPHIERSNHLAPRDVSKLNTLIETATTASAANFTKDQLSALRLKACSGEGANYMLTTYAILAGHVWSCSFKARGLSDDQDVKVYIPTDGRLRFNLPQGYFGNGIFSTACVAKAGYAAWKPLWYAASKIREAVRRMNDEEYLRSAIDYLESEADPTAVVRGAPVSVCPNVSINSWAKLPDYQADFGCGQPMFVGHGGIRSEGQLFILQSRERDGSLLVASKLFTVHMAQFLKYWSEF
ncbi:hypothetical protein Cgig2_033015 [Carnegiea gigantea]|uniref:Uncharacterized protein n=1 Tax=Carnegiea gigantea TaxID=171969 RepID=A0A9Q1QE28_9CARY|nr:hypothetical protein Cgig2_033015 [Carnegiea gigantea]